MAKYPARRAVVKVFAAQGGIKWRPKGRPPPQRSDTSHTSEGESPPTRPGGVSRSRTEPLAPRAVGPGRRHQPSQRSDQPSGIQLLADSVQRPITSNDTHSKKALTLSISAFLVNQRLPILPGRFRQVLSAFVSLTTVFGMGTGVSSQLSPLNL